MVILTAVDVGMYLRMQTLLHHTHRQGQRHPLDRRMAIACKSDTGRSHLALSRWFPEHQVDEVESWWWKTMGVVVVGVVLELDLEYVQVGSQMMVRNLCSASEYEFGSGNGWKMTVLILYFDLDLWTGDSAMISGMRA